MLEDPATTKGRPPSTRPLQNRQRAYGRRPVRQGASTPPPGQACPGAPRCPRGPGSPLSPFGPRWTPTRPLPVSRDTQSPSHAVCNTDAVQFHRPWEAQACDAWRDDALKLSASTAPAAAAPTPTPTFSRTRATYVVAVHDPRRERVVYAIARSLGIHQPSLPAAAFLCFDAEPPRRLVLRFERFFGDEAVDGDVIARGFRVNSACLERASVEPPNERLDDFRTRPEARVVDTVDGDSYRPPGEGVGRCRRPEVTWLSISRRRTAPPTTVERSGTALRCRGRGENRVHELRRDGAIERFAG